MAWPRDLVKTLRALAGGCAGADWAWLDSGPNGRTGFVGFHPACELVQAYGGPAELRTATRTLAREASIWRLFEQVAAPVASEPARGSLGPGWIGYAGFECVALLERLAFRVAPPDALPLARFALFDGGVLLDYERRTASACFLPGCRASLGLPEASLAGIAQAWSAAVAAPQPAPHWRAPRLAAEQTREQYEARVRRVKEYIAAGDVYQVNLAQRLWLEGLGAPLDAFERLREANPAEFGALLQWRDGAVLSLSPELFLHCDGRRVVTRPIKGTRPRRGEPVADEAARRALLASEKDAAELAMIVDLHRNDLGRVCEYGSVRVVQPREVETLASVLHTRAEIQGRLAPGRKPLDALRACFPAGSISGVPKVRALQIIAELEPPLRGAYTGAVGWLGLDGRMTMNVAIRTLQQTGARAALHVGGGIVAESDPAEEYLETLAKAAGLLRGLGIPECPEPRPQPGNP